MLAALVAGAVMALPSAIASEYAHEIGPGQGILISDTNSRDCDEGTLLHNADGTYENGYCVRHGFLEPPDFGAFAECFSGVVEVCSIVLDLSTDYYPDPPPQAPVEVLVWDDNGGEPGLVLCIVTDVALSGIAVWPEISRHEVPLPAGCCTPETWWAGHRAGWGNVPTPCYWYVAADETMPGNGCPRIKVPEGVGYPTGWQDTSVIWGPTAALGLGAWVVDCESTPVMTTTWGRLKQLHR